ncbi:uncharacterized protein SCHCODRAFT_01194438 [Schizophyllum commune H4-8]|nr:uncharacterized protein SCHCODRAFT_01194438 [Schizophyllum commune H4-8]KAI5836631.1 hypothetical protein SCHCODRAFT_01194438 [Schizophyllum commune H4-8]
MSIVRQDDAAHDARVRGFLADVLAAFDASDRGVAHDAGLASRDAGDREAGRDAGLAVCDAGLAAPDAALAARDATLAARDAALAARDAALAALDAGDREAACEYVLNTSGLRKLGGAKSLIRESVGFELKYLPEVLRDDMQLSGGCYTDHLRDEACDRIVWGAVLVAAQHELEVRYADFRRCARWTPTPVYPFEWLLVRHFTRQDERAVVLRLRDALRRSIEALERVPKPRTANLGPIPLRSGSLPLLAVHIIYELHTVVVPTICVASLGELEDLVAYMAERRMGIFVVAVLALSACMYIWYRSRGTSWPAERATRHIVKLRQRSRQEPLLWKTLLALTGRILDEEDMDETVVGNIRRIFDLVDTRMMPYQHPSGEPFPGKTTLEAMHGSMVSVPNGEKLMAEIVARIRPFVQPETDADHVSTEASATTANHHFEEQRRADLGALLSDACDYFGFHDPFFEILGPAAYAGIARLGVQPATRYADELIKSIDDAVDALRELGSIPETMQNFVRNMHLRLAWIGGIGYAQTDIVAQIEVYRREPTREKLQDLQKILDHYLSALAADPPPSFRDLLNANMSKNDRTKLILREMSKICCFTLGCLPLLVMMKLANSKPEVILGVVYTSFLKTVVSPYGLAALEGLYDWATGYRRNEEVHKAANVAADLERLARYHLVGWRALQVAIGGSEAGADEAIVRALMDSIVSAAKPSILVSLVEALDGKVVYGVKRKTYLRTDASLGGAPATLVGGARATSLVGRTWTPTMTMTTPPRITGTEVAAIIDKQSAAIPSTPSSTASPLLVNPPSPRSPRLNAQSHEWSTVHGDSAQNSHPMHAKEPLHARTTAETEERDGE